MMNQILNHNLVKITLTHLRLVKQQVPVVSKWAIPGGLFLSWMAFPALTSDFKASIGL